MVLEIRNRFVFPYRKAIKVLISDRYEENLISSYLVERLSQDLVARAYCHHYDDDFMFS